MGQQIHKHTHKHANRVLVCLWLCGVQGTGGWVDVCPGYAYRLGIFLFFFFLCLD